MATIENGQDLQEDNYSVKSTFSSSSASSRSSASLLYPTPPASPTMNGQSFNGSKNAGPKFKLISEGDIHVCRLNHTRTIVSKIMNSKYLRRWESHHLHLTGSDIKSATVSVENFSLQFS